MWGGTALARPTCNAKQVLEGQLVKLNTLKVSKHRPLLYTAAISDTGSGHLLPSAPKTWPASGSRPTRN